MSRATYDVVVVGAGIVGAACASQLAGRGLRVAVVDRECVGGGATAAGMGHIVVMSDSEAQFALTRYSQLLWRDLSSEMPADVEYQQCGTIWVAEDEEEMGEVRRKQAYYTQRAVPVEVIDGSTLARLEPNLRQGFAGALLVPEDAVLYPPCAARCLMELAKAKGAELHLGFTVSRIGQGRVCARDREFSAGAIVNAAGAWASELMPELDVKKRKGHLLITDRYAGFVRHALVELGYLKSVHSLSSDSVAFNVQPRITGQILIGSSRQYGAETTGVDSEILSRMLRRAQKYMPGLGELSTIRAWTGFRAATPDRVPYIGPWPEDKTIFLATGHEGLGITAALGTGQLVADQLTGTKSRIPIEPYLPARTGAERIHA
ncbi:MAG TPA: FAD-dependent oxidoreductase [Terriglobales bacterium]|nr:FAD-dependent oxidoreductase [Terriglobales bacterium]